MFFLVYCKRYILHTHIYKQMNCKNCHSTYEMSIQFCSNCGAKVVHERLSLKNLWKNFATDFFGWDNKYLKTLWHLITKPKQILDGYISGVRKRYMSPFAFLAIGTAIAILAFNIFQDEYLDSTRMLAESQAEMIVANASSDLDVEALETMRQEVIDDQLAANKSMLNYFNIYTFLMLPLYALMSFLVFGKPHNYGEHLVINSYLQGVIFIFGVIFFLLSLMTNPMIYFISMLASILYYQYAYSKLNEYSAKRSILKLLKFFGLIIAVFLVLSVGGFLIGYLLGSA